MTPAPELEVAQWLNTEQPITLASLRGRVVLLYAFQMRCYGCVEYAIPQAQRAHDSWRHLPVQVLGLHTVFENHAAQATEALRGFVTDNALTFPIGIDSPSPGSTMPRTMRLYDMQGTPTLIAIDAEGRRRRQHLGHRSDAEMEGLVSTLLSELELSTTLG